jgi:hypothetical protein
MSTMPIETLQLRAFEERSQLHKTASELRTKLSRTREKLSLSKQAHDRLLAVSVIAGAVALVSGYGIAGLFSHR